MRRRHCCCGLLIAVERDRPSVENDSCILSAAYRTAQCPDSIRTQIALIQQPCAQFRRAVVRFLVTTGDRWTASPVLYAIFCQGLGTPPG